MILGGVFHRTLEGGAAVYDDQDDAPLLSIRFLNDWASLTDSEKASKLQTVVGMIMNSVEVETEEAGVTGMETVPHLG